MGTKTKRLANIVLTFVLIVLCVLTVALVAPRFFGVTPYAVLSGSMQPQFSVGSLIYVAPTDPETIQPAQAITFEKESGSIVTHQVYEVDHNNGLIYTQGIANQDQNGNILHDADPVPYSHVIGVPVFSVPLLGYVSSFCTTPPGMYVLIAIAIVAVILSFIADGSKSKRHSCARH